MKGKWMVMQNPILAGEPFAVFRFGEDPAITEYFRDKDGEIVWYFGRRDAQFTADSLNNEVDEK